MRPNKITQEEILIAAEKLIREEGLESCSMRKLAKHCKTAVGTLYNYYPSHKALLEDLFILSWRKTLVKLKQVKANSVEDHLGEFIDILASEVKARDGLGIILYGNSNFSSFLNDENHILSEVLCLLVEILAQSDLYKNRNPEIIHLNAQWILMITMDYLTKDKVLIKILKNELILRFL